MCFFFIQRPVVCICWMGAIVISSCTLICENANPPSPSSPPSSILASLASRSRRSLSSLSSRSLSALSEKLPAFVSHLEGQCDKSVYRVTNPKQCSPSFYNVPEPVLLGDVAVVAVHGELLGVEDILVAKVAKELLIVLVEGARVE